MTSWSSPASSPGRWPSRWGPFSVADALNTVAAGLDADRARPRGPPQGRGAAPPSAPPATGHRRRVEQIVTNLAANAIKFAGFPPVELTGRFEGPIAVLAVRDEGPGIASRGPRRVFERFYRMADHEPITGTGLGLPIARDLARAMGGELDVASVPGVGSSFVLVLPGPASTMPAAAMATATGAALAFESEHLRTLGLLRAGAAAAGRGAATSRRSTGDIDDLPLGVSDDEPRDGHDDDRPGHPRDQAPLSAGFRP